MSEFKIIGSNIIRGEEVELQLKITKNGTVFGLQPKTRIILSNVSDVMAKTPSPSVSYQDSVQRSDSSFKFNPNYGNYYYDTLQQIRQLDYFEIQIKGKINPNFGQSSQLQIQFQENGAEQCSLTFEVYKEDELLSIKSFEANCSLIQLGRKTLSLSYEIEGNPQELVLLKNGVKISDLKPTEKKGTIPLANDSNNRNGLYEYTLHAIAGNKSQYKSTNVNFVEASEIHPRYVPAGFGIVNFCISADEAFLFALMLNTDATQWKLFYTHQINGDTTWNEVLVSDMASLKLFATSPMIHLLSSDEKANGALGRVYFIGGSRLGMIEEEDTDEMANRVAELTLSNTDEDNKIVIHEPNSWSKRWGHSCVLFPKGENEHTIYLMGGQDEYGNTSNEVWTSSDGLKWDKEPSPSWKARCQHSACVSYQYKNGKRTKDALWVAGGFENIGCDLIPDIWKYDIGTKQWSLVNNQLPTAKSIGIGYGGAEATDETGIYVMGYENLVLFKKLKRDNGGKYILIDDEIRKPKFTSYNQGVLLTAFFKECLWLMSATNEGANGVNCSDVFYRIPTISETTFHIYNN